jgi:hypothetical protein
MTFGIVAFVSLLFAWCARNSFVTRRYKSRFAKAFLEEFKQAYPESASLLPPELGSQIAYILVNNKQLAKELNDLESLVAKRPEIRNKSYANFDPDYSPETRRLITELLKNKIELARKIFDGLPPKVKSQINKKAESIDKTVAEAESSNEELKKARKKEEERADYFGVKTWRFSILMNVYDIATRANLAAS